jgi:predicted nuclease of restriction endonuclease-like (RecB) superfamily
MSSKKKASKATPEETSDTRLSRGRTRPGAIFPVAPSAASLPESYAATLQEIKSHLRSARIRAILAVNPIVIEAYWHTGKIILARQQEAAWGEKVIDRLAADLQAEFPDMSGLTRRNLFSMRAFAEAFPDATIVKRLVSQLPWGQIIRLIQMVKDPATREFYIRECLAHGWSRDILEIQIRNQLHLRAGKAQNNFALTMPPADSDMAAQLFKDPYLFDFLGTADPRREAEVEQALVDHIQKFLLELGTGFAFVGRQVRLEVGDEDYPLDLLFYHLKLRRYVVIELKARSFTPGDVGQLNLYLSAVDDLLRHPDDQPTIGLLLCRKKNKLVAEYALRGLDQSIAVAAWQTQLTESLPEELRSSLPSIKEIEAELANDLPPV